MIADRLDRALRCLYRISGRAALVSAAALLLASCGGSSSADPSGSYEVSAPEHPAMGATVQPASGGDSRMPPGHGAMPPGHPPVPAGAGGGGMPPAAQPSGAQPATIRPPTPPAGTSLEPDADGLVAFGGIRCAVPEGWTLEPPANSWRLAQFRIPAAEGDDRGGIVTVSSAMGSMADNVRRWERQFQEAPKAIVSERDAGGLAVFDVRLAGTFLEKERPMSRDPAVPRPDYAMRALVVQGPRGQIFFKGWGPKATMEQGGKGFDALVESLRKE